jgi:hypothetical protein
MPATEDIERQRHNSRGTSQKTRMVTRPSRAVMLLRPVNPLIQFVVCYNVRKHQSEIR